MTLPENTEITQLKTEIYQLRELVEKLLEKKPEEPEEPEQEKSRNMTPKQKLIYCLTANCVILFIVMALIIGLAEETAFWSFGWSDTLFVISVRINTPIRYAILLLLIFIINTTRVIVEELGMPVLGFSIYNPDKKKISDFTKNELQFFANSMFMVSGLRGLFMTMISITQFDIALWSLIVSEITSFFTIRMLLDEKTFVQENPKYKELDTDDMV